MGSRPVGTGDITVVPRNGEYPRELRRAMQRNLPRGDIVMFQDDLLRQFPNIGNLSRDMHGRVNGGCIYNQGYIQHKQEIETAIEIFDSTDFFVETITEQASIIYNLFKKRCLIADSLEEVGRIATKYWAVQGAKIASGYSVEQYDRTLKCVITKAMWQEAIYTVLCMHQADGDEKVVYRYDQVALEELERENTTMLGLIYVHTFAILGVICGKKRAEQDARKAQRDVEVARRKADSVKSSVRVERLQKQLTEVQAKSSDKIASLQRTVESLSLDIKAISEKKDIEIQRLEEELAVYRSIEDQAEKVDDALHDDAPLLELPETDVMFVGGHPNLVAKLRAEHSGWKFISSVSEVPEPVLCSHVFYYARHISHKVQYKLRRYYDGPIMYCDGINLDKLHESMQRVFTACTVNGLCTGKVHG